MIDIYSRFVVRVADHAHESGPPAAEMMKECFGIHGTPAGGQPCVHHLLAQHAGPVGQPVTSSSSTRSTARPATEPVGNV